MTDTRKKVLELTDELSEEVPWLNLVLLGGTEGRPYRLHGWVHGYTPWPDEPARSPYIGSNAKQAGATLRGLIQGVRYFRDVTT